MAPTLRDIAQKAGVSSTVVSDILNRGKADKYSKTTITTIQQLADRLGYEVNHAAKTLKSGRTGNLGIVDLYGMLYHDANSYFAHVMTGISAAASRQGMNLVFIQGAFEDGRLLVPGPAVSQADGLVYVLLSQNISLFNQDVAPILKKQDIPAVVIHSFSRGVGFHSVGVDCDRGGYAAAMHLLKDHGYDSLGVAACEFKYRHHDELIAGCRRAARDQGVFFSSSHIYRAQGYQAHSGYRLMDDLLRRRIKLPRAMICVQDSLALGIMRRLEEAGMRVPEDMALVGFDNFSSEYLDHIGLASITQPAVAKGRAAVEMLTSLMEKEPAEINTEILPADLKTRRSCGCIAR